MELINIFSMPYRLFLLRTAAALLLSAISLIHIEAQEQKDTLGGKIITNAKMIGVGSTHILDTYISPEKYSGVEIRYISHTIREREGRRWSREIVHQGYVSFSDNRANEGEEIAGMYSFSYGFHYNWHLDGGNLNIRAGALLDANLGFLYNTRNGNNPAQARVNVNLSPSAAASYRFTLWKMPMTIGYEASAPLVGVMFSPNYGQSYYEIFNEGNYDHNIVPTWTGTTPSLRQMVTLDFRLRKMAIRVGYVGDYQQYEVNNLKYHNYSHLFVIGIVKRFKIEKLAP